MIPSSGSPLIMPGLSAAAFEGTSTVEEIKLIQVHAIMSFLDIADAHTQA